MPLIKCFYSLYLSILDNIVVRLGLTLRGMKGKTMRKKIAFERKKKHFL